MPRSLRALLIALALTAGASLHAQEVLTFDQAIRLGLERNPDLRQAALADESSALNVDLARADALPLPFVTASVQPTQRYGLAFDQTTGQLTSQTSEALNVGVSAQVNLFDGFRNRRALERARIERRASAFTLERTRQQVAFDIASRFLQVVLNGEIVGIREEALAAQRAQLDQVQALVDGGVRPEADIFSQRALVAQAELALLQAQQAVELAKTQLVQVLQLDPFADYAFVAPALDESALGADPVALDVLLRAAYERRPDLRAQEQRITAAEAGIGVARSARLPSVDFSAGVGTGYSSLQQRLVDGDEVPVLLPVTTSEGDPILVAGEPFEIPLQTTPDLEPTPFLTQLGDNRGGSIGFTLSIPIFDRYQTRRQVQLARIEADRETIALDRLRQQVAVEVRQAVLDYRSAAAQLDVAGAQLEAAEAALRAQRDRYELGAGVLVELAQAQAVLVEARSARAQAVYEFFFRRKLIDFALGEVDLDAALFD